MSITSLRRTLSPRVSPLRRSEFCTDDPDDTVCLARGNGGDGGVGNGVDGGKIDVSRCTSNAQCALPTPICDTTRSMCVQCTTAESSACQNGSVACFDVSGAGSAPLPGRGNLLVDPQFVDIEHSDLHLQGAGRDMGADEIQ